MTLVLRSHPVASRNFWAVMSYESSGMPASARANSGRSKNVRTDSSHKYVTAKSAASRAACGGRKNRASINLRTV